MVSAAGMLGAVLLPVAWLLHTYSTYISGDAGVADSRIPALYASASVLLAYHAFQLRDLPFLVLTVSLAMFTGTELMLLLHVKRSGNIR